MQLIYWLVGGLRRDHPASLLRIVSNGNRGREKDGRGEEVAMEFSFDSDDNVAQMMRKICRPVRCPISGLISSADVVFGKHDSLFQPLPTESRVTQPDMDRRQRRAGENERQTQKMSSLTTVIATEAPGAGTARSNHGQRPGRRTSREMTGMRS